MVGTQVIKSLSEYIEYINSIELKKSSPNYAPKMFFRGLRSTEHALIPCLAQRPSERWFNQWSTVEESLIREAQQKFPLIFNDTGYPALLLAKLQHFGIPTRMMDITENALVALYFACQEDESPRDGLVFVFQEATVSAYDPIVNMIADTYRLTKNSCIDLNTFIFRALHQPYATPLLYEGWEDPSHRIWKSIAEELKRPRFVEVGKVCERQAHQRGQFIIFPNHIHEHSGSLGMMHYLDELDESDSCITNIVQIPSSCKKSFLEGISRLGVTKEFLFADDTDGVCRSIVSEYRSHYGEYLFQKVSTK